LEDSRKGEIDLILTKSISRFARNMAECAEMVRELRCAGVNIRFERENLNSRDTKCDLLLNIFSAIAQEESNSISRHSVASHDQYAREGRPYGRTAFGYRNAGDNVWEVYEKDADKVRTAFAMAAEGRTYKEILAALNEKETDGYTWKTTRLKSILMNPVYIGDYYSHKKVCLVPGKAVVNYNYRDRYYIKGHHEAIVSTDLYNSVQEIISRNLLNSHRKRSEDDIALLKGAVKNGCNEN
ncbi:MAG: recombinase family protein, partial [Clostridia bacterium]|nr:recombinase family protein [Clostridia bacterium]